MKRSVALAGALALPLVSIAELFGVWKDTSSAPQIVDFSAVKAGILAERRSGDVVVITPAWAEPNARAALGDELFPLRDLARADDTRALRLLVVGPRGSFEGVANFRETEARPLSLHLELHVLENLHPAIVQTDLVDEIEAGRVRVFSPTSAPTGECAYTRDLPILTEGLFGPPAFPANRFLCGKEPWQNVSVTIQEDEHWKPRRCIWAHPAEGGDVVMRFEDVALGPLLHGHLGLHWTLEREGNGAPIDLEFRVDDRSIGVVRHDDGEGWKPFALETHATGSRGTIEARVRSVDVSARHLCFEADLRGKTP